MSSESKVASIAANLLQRLTEDASRKTFGVSAERLSRETRKDLALQFEDTLRKYTSAFYGRTAKQHQVTSEYLIKRADELISDLQGIIAEAVKKVSRGGLEFIGGLSEKLNTNCVLRGATSSVQTNVAT